MPTIKPRTTVTLEPGTHEVIERLAVLQRRTRGSVISEMLDSIAPALTRTVAILEAAAIAPLQVQQGFRDVVEGVHRDFLQAAGSDSFRMDQAVSDGSRSAVDPHVVTRGSGLNSDDSSPSPKKRSKRSKPGGVADE